MKLQLSSVSATFEKTAKITTAQATVSPKPAAGKHDSATYGRQCNYSLSGSQFKKCGILSRGEITAK
jgi:hypothetical protein